MTFLIIHYNLAYNLRLYSTILVTVPPNHMIFKIFLPKTLLVQIQECVLTMANGINQDVHFKEDFVLFVMSHLLMEMLH
jgi:hypothetical protein